MLEQFLNEKHSIMSQEVNGTTTSVLKIRLWEQNVVALVTIDYPAELSEDSLKLVLSRKATSVLQIKLLPV